MFTIISIINAKKLSPSDHVFLRVTKSFVWRIFDCYRAVTFFAYKRVANILNYNFLYLKSLFSIISLHERLIRSSVHWILGLWNGFLLPPTVWRGALINSFPCGQPLSEVLFISPKSCPVFQNDFIRLWAVAIEYTLCSPASRCVVQEFDRATAQRTLLLVEQGSDIPPPAMRGFRFNGSIHVRWPRLSLNSVK